jgi:RHS repeat-associated protein
VQSSGTPQAEDSYYGYNPHTDVETLTKDNGDTRATYGYTAYGKDDKEAFTGIDKPDVQQPDKQPFNFYRYNGKRFDPSSGSYDMGFRDYSPGLNRFMTRDMYNGALADMNLGSDPFTGNRYAFAGGNPVTGVEADGHGLCADTECRYVCSAECSVDEAYGLSEQMADDREAAEAEEKWIGDHSPNGDNALYIGTLWDKAADPMSGTDDWEPVINPNEGTLCFGRVACREASRHLLLTQGKDLAGAKMIAATYCIDNMEKCVSDARDMEIASQMYYTFLSALFMPGVGRGGQRSAAAQQQVVRGLGAELRTADDVMANPRLLAGKSQKEVEAIIGNSPGWEVGALRQGRNAGRGWTFREKNAAGTDYTGRYIQWHPGSSRHYGGAPYWKVSNGPLGTTRFPQ